MMSFEVCIEVDSGCSCVGAPMARRRKLPFGAGNGHFSSRNYSKMRGKKAKIE